MKTSRPKVRTKQTRRQRKFPPVGRQRTQLTCHNEHRTKLGVDDMLTKTCLTPPGGKCFSLVQDYVDPDTGRLETERIYGCLPADKDGFLFQCGFAGDDPGEQQATLRMPPLNGKTIVCCDTDNMCNQFVHPTYTQRAHMLPPLVGSDISWQLLGWGSTTMTATAATLIASLGVAALVVVLATVVCAIVWCRRRRRRRNRTVAKDVESTGAVDGNETGDTVPTDDATAAKTTAADAVWPFTTKFVQRTIVKEIAGAQPLGQGRFGDVWLAEFRGERVAVKVFLAATESVCLHEAYIYKSVMMRHENIQRFIGADIDSAGRRLLVTHYHELGTLHSFLLHAGAPLTTQQLYTLAYSLAAGLAHLHTEICGLSGKPAIAHGAINCRNVLVRKDMQCVIADFGLAVKYLSDTDDIVRSPAETVATPDWRYAAPELLNDTFVSDMFKPYQMADMYAAGLVWWQMTRCCGTPKATSEAAGMEGHNDGVLECEGYALPYADELPGERMGVPLREDVRRIVCADDDRPEGGRPPVPARWAASGNEVIRLLSPIMVDCWKENAAARLTALRVKKTLGKLSDNPVD